ncbi:hypothetical protein ElyMa_001175800 [Elysia marginata]|uniref:Peptidase M12A domain-containing protein n=1 Tax=Elysia marginata TaxID=1093978 RepID=A0AAV4I4E8_9GAST|nr:hypothetical protein ElyMa_001175800 [Elysia marginata]
MPQLVYRKETPVKSTRKQIGMSEIKRVGTGMTALLLLIQFLLVPGCCGFRSLPIKQSRTVESYSSIDTGRLRVVKREVPSLDVLSKMENNLNGISGNGYYIDVNIGTPPQTVSPP